MDKCGGAVRGNYNRLAVGISDKESAPQMERYYIGILRRNNACGFYAWTHRSRF